MRMLDWSEWSDDDLLANAAAQAERWERILSNGGGHKLADRPDRSSKRKSHSGPSRSYGRLDESGSRSYEYAEAHGDMLTTTLHGDVYGMPQHIPMDASWYGDAYGTGRHYAHIEAQVYQEHHGRGMGQTARTGRGKVLVLNLNGTHSMTVNVKCDDCLCDIPTVVRFDYPTLPSADVLVNAPGKRGRPRKHVNSVTLTETEYQEVMGR